MDWARNMQLVYQEEEHIELADGAQASGDFSKLFVEFARGRAFELKDGYEFADPTRGDADAVQAGDLTAFEAIEASREAVQTRLQQLSNERRLGLGHGVGRKRVIIVGVCA